jgi:H+-transporting ATPase
LKALKSRLALNASVKRDNAWKIVPADLVVGDVVNLSLGAVVAVDVRLTEGSVLLDQSMLRSMRRGLPRTAIPSLVKL